MGRGGVDLGVRTPPLPPAFKLQDFVLLDLVMKATLELPPELQDCL